MSKSKNVKTQKVGETTYAWTTDWIYSLEAEHKWRLYWRQQKIMEKEVLSGQNVLEIGVGNSFTSNYLKSKGVKVTTMDIDSDKKPDIIANIVTCDWSKYLFDHILAFEVFEHIPYPEFEALLTKMKGSCKNCLFMSVPRNEGVWGEFKLNLNLPIFKRLNNLSYTFVNKKESIHVRHFWELGHQNITQEKFEKSINQSG